MKTFAKRLFQRRFPTYFFGFSLGLLAVVAISQIKKAVAPVFTPVLEQRNIVLLSKGGSLRLKLGESPEKFLAWGFPTRLALGKKKENGRVEPLFQLEYAELVEKETLLGPLKESGEYDLVGHFFVCAFPGEKFCAKVILEQSLKITGEADAPLEAGISLDLKKAALGAAQIK